MVWPERIPPEKFQYKMTPGDQPAPERVTLAPGQPGLGLMLAEQAAKAGVGAMNAAVIDEAAMSRRIRVFMGAS